MVQQLTIASDTQYEVTLRDVAVDAADRLGAPALGLGDVGGGAARCGVPARRPGDRRGARTRSTSPCSTRRTATSSTSRSARSRRSPTISSDAVTEVDGAEQLVHEAAWARATGRPLDRLAPMAKLFACRTFRDVTAMAQQVFGGSGFHRRLRHPALLPPGQATPAQLGRQQGARGAGRGERARLGPAPPVWRHRFGSGGPFGSQPLIPREPGPPPV